MSNKIAVVTGGTSGIGREAALYLAKNGCTVYELSRRKEGVGGLRHISADVTDETSVNAAVAQILAEAGRIDILVNNAGFGISGAVEFTDTAEAQRQLDVNFFGMVRMNKAVIAVMRQQGSGRIVNLSSVAAPVPIPFQTYYSASKAAINSYTMALGNELRPFGITVCAVMPGDIKTGFTAARRKVAEGDDVSGGRNFQSTVVGFDSSTLNASGMLARWVSDNDKNMINYNNPEYDKVMQEANASTDDAKQTELYKQAAAMLSETAANVYIQDLADFVLLKNNLDGYQFYPLYVMDLSTVHYVQ